MSVPYAQIQHRNEFHGLLPCRANRTPFVGFFISVLRHKVIF